MILRAVAAVFGILELLFPKAIVRLMMNFTTEGEADYEFKAWVYTLARLEGFVIFICALRCWKSQKPSEE
jgi:hypothetical protein